MQEVISVMGKPTHQEQLPSEIGGQTFLYYLPGGLASFEKALTQFDSFALMFDGDGKLKEVNGK